MDINKPIPTEGKTKEQEVKTSAGCLPSKKWRKPQLTVMDIRSETLLGGTTGNEGNGVFAFRQT